MCQCQPLEQNYHQGGFAFRSEDTTAFIPLSLSLFSLLYPPPRLPLSLSPCCVAAVVAALCISDLDYCSSFL